MGELMRAEILVNVLSSARRNDQGCLELPPWGHPINAGVLPLFATRSDRFEPIGTAFFVTRYGHIVTATHNLDEVLKKEPGGERHRGGVHPIDNLNLRVAGLAVLHTYDAVPRRRRAALWPFDRSTGASPTDIAFCSPVWHIGQEPLPILNLPITFDPPRVGSMVSCVGYPGIKAPPGGLTLAELESGEWSERYEQRLNIVEGQVREIFTQRFAKGFAEGPCFSFDSDVGPGFSGGPVVNAEGYVCGVLWAGATSFFPRPSALASLLFPTLLTNIPTRLQWGEGKVQMDLNRPLYDVIANGGVETDGSEERVPLVPAGDGHRVDLRVPRADEDNYHDDFRGMQDGVGATLVPELKALFLRRGVSGGIADSDENATRPELQDDQHNGKPK